jgi:hypothetical protein
MVRDPKRCAVIPFNLVFCDRTCPCYHAPCLVEDEFGARGCRDRWSVQDKGLIIQTARLERTLMPRFTMVRQVRKRVTLTQI